MGLLLRGIRHVKAHRHCKGRPIEKFSLGPLLGKVPAFVRRVHVDLTETARSRRALVLVRPDAYTLSDSKRTIRGPIAKVSPNLSATSACL